MNVDQELVRSAEGWMLDIIIEKRPDRFFLNPRKLEEFSVDSAGVDWNKPAERPKSSGLHTYKKR